MESKLPLEGWAGIRRREERERERAKDRMVRDSGGWREGENEKAG